MREYDSPLDRLQKHHQLISQQEESLLIDQNLISDQEKELIEEKKIIENLFDNVKEKIEIFGGKNEKSIEKRNKLIDFLEKIEKSEKEIEISQQKFFTSLNAFSSFLFYFLFILIFFFFFLFFIFYLFLFIFIYFS